MGRRSRQKAKPRTPTHAPQDDVARERMARVLATDDVWTDFRAACAYRPISVVLGELVEREVARYRSRRVRDGELEPRELVEALEQARQQQEDLAALVARLEQLRSAAAR